MGYIKAIFQLFGIAALVVLGLMLAVSILGDIIQEWEIIGPMLLIGGISCISGMVAYCITLYKLNKPDPDDPCRVYRNGKEILTEDEELERKGKAGFVMAAVSFPMLFIGSGIYWLITL